MAAVINASDQQLAEVVAAIRQTPIIDHHAHPLLRCEVVGQHELMTIITEAHGDALGDAVTTLAFHRAVQQLADALGCAPTWEAVVAAVEKHRRGDYKAWVAQCFEGLETILLDDGLNSETDVHGYTWHDQFTRSRCRRIVRIETVAATIIQRHVLAYDDMRPLNMVFDTMLEEFDTYIHEALADPEVVGFKSIICYRAGLDVPKAVNIAAARASFADILTTYAASARPFVRLQHVGLNELFAHRTAVHIRDLTSGPKKPIQFHTGLGDNDITLTRSSPAHLQEFIRTYPTVPIVLLHSGYPHMRDTAYLAAMYANVYADIGEVFPFINRDGQETVVREILELCPWSKVLWSTDGHWFPETYILAVKQVREVLETVLCDFVRKRDISCQSAVELTEGILFKNANKVYHLGLDFARLPVQKPVQKPETSRVVPISSSANMEAWNAFLRNNAPPDFIRLSWLDYTAKPRMRMVPFRHFDRLVREGKRLDIGISKAALDLLQNDITISSASAAGEYRLHPDLTSLRPGPIAGHANVYGDFRESDGSAVSMCPRTQLAQAVDASAAAGFSHLIGFEIEFILLQRTADTKAKFGMLENDSHAWSVSRFYVDPVLPQLLRDIVEDLATAGIYVEQVHPESAPGQFEIVLPPQAPVEAVDALLHARDTIAARATAAGFRFTLHPKPFADACGTAAHMHLSVSRRTGDSCVETKVYESFYAGILGHLPALAAFTYSHPASYLRVVDSHWAGGRWVTWGEQNRETPLRKIEGSHWELKCIDGLANTYLAVAAILRAGLSGIETQAPLTWGNCVADPAMLTEAERSSLGITTMFPENLPTALDVLAADETLKRLMGPEMVKQYVDVKRAELAELANLDAAKHRQWVIENY